MKIAVAVGVVIVLLVGGYTVIALGHKGTQSSAIQMEPATSVRAAVSGKKTADVSCIIVEAPWSQTPTIVTDRGTIAAFLKGMREAVRPKIQCGCGGPNVTVVWKSGEKSGPFGFDIEHGPSHAYGLSFAQAYNRIAEPDRRISLSQ